MERTALLLHRLHSVSEASAGTPEDAHGWMKYHDMRCGAWAVNWLTRRRTKRRAGPYKSARKSVVLHSVSV